MATRFATDYWHRQILKALKHPAVEITLLVLVILVSAWVIVDSDALKQQAGMPIFSR